MNTKLLPLLFLLIGVIIDAIIGYTVMGDRDRSDVSQQTASSEEGSNAAADAAAETASQEAPGGSETETTDASTNNASEEETATANEDADSSVSNEDTKDGDAAPTLPTFSILRVGAALC